MFIQSSSIRFTSRPHRAEAVAIAPIRAFFNLDGALEAVGTVTFAGRRGETMPAGWTVGFAQAEWADTSWFLYRGARHADGSVFVQRSRPPARPQQACRDSSHPNDPFYGDPAHNQPHKPIGGGPALRYVETVPAAAALPVAVNVRHYDEPQDLCSWVWNNATTGKPNTLREAQLEFMFCTVLVARDPQGKMHMLRGFYWNVAWQAAFPAQADGTVHGQPVPGGSHAHVGQVFVGAPTDPRFLPVLTQPQSMTCNQLTWSSSATPNVKEAAGWPDFDVRR